MVHTSGLLFRTVLVAWGDVFLLLVGIFSSISGIVLVGLSLLSFDHRYVEGKTYCSIRGGYHFHVLVE